MKIDEMRILLTGASGGIGKALATCLLDAGASVLLSGRDESKLEAIKRSFPNKRCDFIVGDLNTDINEITLAATCFGANVLINNAGVSDFCAFEESNIEKIIGANVIGTMSLTQALLPHLKHQDRSMIVNIGSTFGAIGYPGYVSYCASKHAIKGFSEALRREVSDTNISIIYCSPRATQTEINTDAATQANIALGVKTDSPIFVAEAIFKSMQNQLARQQLGWPEKLQVKLNAIIPAVVDSAIAKQLATLKSYYQKERYI